MPLVQLDTEQADLLRVATEMLSGALRARVKRADPDKIISNSLVLQSNKLESALAQLALPDPPRWEHMTEQRQRHIIQLCSLIAGEAYGSARGTIVQQLRGALIAPNTGDGKLSLDPPMADRARRKAQRKPDL